MILWFYCLHNNNDNFSDYFFYFFFEKIIYFFLILQGNLMIFIVWAVMLIIILMIMTVTWRWIFNLCFLFFGDRKLITYFCYLMITGVFTTYILFVVFNLNWIIKWIDCNIVNSIIQVFESSYFFNDNYNLILMILLKPTKYINLYWFKIYIFYRKLALHRNSTQIYYFV